MTEPTLYLLLAGLIGGFFAGFLGIGGGIIFISILPFILSSIGISGHEVVQYTIANSIFATFFASFGANITQIINKNFYLKQVLLIGVSGGLVGIFTLDFMVYSDWYTPIVFNWVIVLLLIYIMISTLRVAKRSQSYHDEGKHHNGWLITSGGFSGIIAAISGLGGGIVIIPILNSILAMNIKKAQSISLGVIFISSLILSIKNMLAETIHVYEYSIGYIIFPVVLPLVIGVVLSAPLGVMAARRVASYILSIIFAIFVFLLIGFKIYEIYGL